VDIPNEYILTKFLGLAGYPESINGNYRGCCPSCHEGKSWGIKKRLHLLFAEKILHCHNCGQTWNYLSWLQNVAGMSFTEIKTEISELIGEDFTYFTPIVFEEQAAKELHPPLPKHSINLSDSNQVSFYRNNRVISNALQVVSSRRLNTAINAPPTFYVSLNDPIHKNRLVIPFRDGNNDIVYYQSRRLLNDDSAKYLSKVSPRKHVYGLDAINPEIPYIFAFEGPIDAMFVQNGIAVAGLTITPEQAQDIFNIHPLAEFIWVIDNPQIDKSKEARAKFRELAIDRQQRVFCWKDDFSEHKDLNDFCVTNQLDECPYELIIEHSFIGMKAML
jgi:hypothetical protein